MYLFHILFHRIGTTKYQKILHDQNQYANCSRLIGRNALENRGVLSLSHIYNENYNTSADLLSEVFVFLFNSELSIDAKEHPLLLTEPLFTSVQNRMELAQILFETYAVPSLMICPQPALPL